MFNCYIKRNLNTKAIIMNKFKYEFQLKEQQYLHKNKMFNNFLLNPF